MSAVPASSAVHPISTDPGRRVVGRRTLARATLAAGLVVAGVGLLATSASATTAAVPAASATSADDPSTTEPVEGTVVVTIIPPAAAEPATTVPAPVIRSEAIVRPSAPSGQVATAQARTQSSVPRAESPASVTKTLPRLPETGSTTGPLVLGGAGLVGLGIVALAFGRRTQAA